MISSPAPSTFVQGVPMLTRRQLLSRGTTVLLLVPILGCSSSSSSSPPPVDASSAPGCNGIESTSTINAQHTHTVCVLTSDLTTPPTAGATYTTSNVGNHTHTIMLAQADLTAINGGQTITVTSSNVVDPLNGAAHTHMFAIMKM